VIVLHLGTILLSCLLIFVFVTLPWLIGKSLNTLDIPPPPTLISSFLLIMVETTATWQKSPSVYVTPVNLLGGKHLSCSLDYCRYDFCLYVIIYCLYPICILKIINFGCHII